MKHAIADKLVYAHEALHLEQKMQDAGWAADIERWESGTDSELSDEEVDFKEGSNLSNTQVSWRSACSLSTDAHGQRWGPWGRGTYMTVGCACVPCVLSRFKWAAVDTMRYTVSSPSLDTVDTNLTNM